MTRYWQWWAIVSFVAFIVPEVWALCTNVKNTLSWKVWHLEAFNPDKDHILDWSALHFLVGGCFLIGMLWLTGHLVFGLWR